MFLLLNISYSNTIISLDGYKSSFLMKAYNLHKKLGSENFVVIAHPKGLNDFALANLEKFFKLKRTSVTFTNLIKNFV